MSYKAIRILYFGLHYILYHSARYEKKNKVCGVFHVRLLTNSDYFPIHFLAL